jgi:hypothetical protein
MRSKRVGEVGPKVDCYFYKPRSIYNAGKFCYYYGK